MTWPPGLVERYEADYAALTRVAFVLLGSRHEAEEVVQDAFVALRPRWDAVDNPGGYLRRSVVHGAYARAATPRRRRAPRSRSAAAGSARPARRAAGCGARAALEAAHGHRPALRGRPSGRRDRRRPRLPAIHRSLPRGERARHHPLRGDRMIDLSTDAGLRRAFDDIGTWGEPAVVPDLEQLGAVRPGHEHEPVGSRAGARRGRRGAAPRRRGGGARHPGRPAARGGGRGRGVVRDGREPAGPAPVPDLAVDRRRGAHLGRDRRNRLCGRRAVSAAHRLVGADGPGSEWGDRRPGPCRVDRRGGRVRHLGGRSGDGRIGLGLRHHRLRPGRGRLAHARPSAVRAGSGHGCPLPPGVCAPGRAGGPGGRG